MTEPASAQELFKGRHFDQEIIILCVRWYLAFKLSSRDLVQMMAERGILPECRSLSSDLVSGCEGGHRRQVRVYVDGRLDLRRVCQSQNEGQRGLRMGQSSWHRWWVYH